jgi:hypothetical protein
MFRPFQQEPGYELGNASSNDVIDVQASKSPDPCFGLDKTHYRGRKYGTEAAEKVGVCFLQLEMCELMITWRPIQSNHCFCYAKVRWRIRMNSCRRDIKEFNQY